MIPARQVLEPTRGARTQGAIEHVIEPDVETDRSAAVPFRRSADAPVPHRDRRQLSPRGAKRMVERTLKRAPRPDRTVAPLKGSAHRPVVSALAMLAVAGFGVVMALPVNAVSAVSPIEDTTLLASGDPQTLEAASSEAEVGAIHDPGLVGAKEAPEPEPVAAPLVSVATPGGSAYTTNPNWSVQWPIQFTAPISDWYGYSPSRGRMHYGIDITPGYGVPIVAIADGVVQSPPGWPALGNHVSIYYPELGVTSVYAHMAAPASVSPGAKVVAGQQVGQVGSTGLSTGAHLHFEIHVGSSPIDPYEFMKAHAGP